MAVAASGPLRIAHLSTEYGGTGVRRLSQYRRGHASGYVKANAANNGAVNHSAAVPTSGPMRMSVFRSQAKGWTYTNATARIANATTSHYHCHVEFGDDWLGTPTWPCFYINNAVIGSTSTSWYALVIYGRSNGGTFTFTNNNEIQGAGGLPNSGSGQHAVYIYNTLSGANRPIFINNYAVRGGGGAGGIGGTGGTGGQGYYNYTVDSGLTYARNSYDCAYDDHANRTTFYWAGGAQVGVGGNVTAAASGIYTYYRGGLVEQINSDFYGGQGHVYQYTIHTYHYQCKQTYTATAYTSGGGGGGGGNGGRGIGYNSPNQGGAGGAGGAPPGTNAGWGGTGGTGGTGGSWGAAGNTGNTGATGGSGNYTGGSGGAAGAAGGSGGYSIYAASPWGFTNNNTINGLYGGGVGPT